VPSFSVGWALPKSHIHSLILPHLLLIQTISNVNFNSKNRFDVMATIMMIFAIILILLRLPAFLRWLGWARPTLGELRREAATLALLAEGARDWEGAPPATGWAPGERQSEWLSRLALEVAAEWKRRKVGGWRGWGRG